MVVSNLTACHVLNLTLMGFCTVMEENGKPSDVFGCLSISQLIMEYYISMFLSV